MHIAVIALDGDVLVDMRVDDPLWRGAFVPLDALPPAERAWVSHQARRIVELAVGGQRESRVRLISDGVTLRVSTRDDEGTSRALAEVVPAVRNGMDALLEAVQGCLLFGEGARGLSRRGRGDSVAG